MFKERSLTAGGRIGSRGGENFGEEGYDTFLE